MPNDSARFQVAPPEKGRTLAAVLKQRLALSWSSAKRLIEERRVRVNGQTCAEVARRLQPGMTIDVRRPKSEIRKRTRESRPKSEIRNPKSEIAGRELSAGGTFHAVGGQDVRQRHRHGLLAVVAAGDRNGRDRGDGSRRRMHHAAVL